MRGGGVTTGWALAIAGATYLGAIVHHGHRVDAAAPLVALLLLLCGELAAWSLDERYAIASDDGLGWRRGATIGALALVGVGAAALVLALTAVPATHGLALTALGAIAAIGLAALAGRLVRR